MWSTWSSKAIDRTIEPKLGPTRGPEATSHNMFGLKGANGGEMPITRYFKMNIAFLGLKVQRVGVLVVKDQSDLLEIKKNTKLPGIIGWNLIRLVYQEFIKKHPVEVFNGFQCPQNVDPLLFSRLCVYYYTDIRPTVVSEVKEGDQSIWVRQPLLATELSEVEMEPQWYHMEIN